MGEWVSGLRVLSGVESDAVISLVCFHVCLTIPLVLIIGSAVEHF